MKVKKVHNVISFNQNKWLEKIRGFNTQKRNKARNDFEKDFYKLLIYQLLWKDHGKYS